MDINEYHDKGYFHGYKWWFFESQVLPINGVNTVTCIVNKGNNFVLVSNKNKKGWEFPGGHIEKNESCLDAVQREVLEETGYQVDQLTLVGYYLLLIHNKLEYSALYKAKATKQVSSMTCEIDEIKFVKQEDIGSYICDESNYLMLQKLQLLQLYTKS